MKNVQFTNMGQDGFVEDYDLRGALAYLGLGTIDPSIKPSVVQGCSFINSDGVTIGIVGTSGLTVDNNVVYNCPGNCEFFLN